MSRLLLKGFLLVIVLCAASSLVAAGTNPPGRLFLAANAVEDGVVSLPSGLQYKVLESGSGTEHPFEDSPCLIHYEGRLLNDLVFDSSYNRGKPVTYAPKQLILGWTEALQLMVVGDKWELYIPSELAYGDAGSPPNIRGGDVLIFQIELLDVLPNPAQQAALDAAAKEEPTAEMTFEEEELALEEAVAKEQLGLEETAATERPTAEEAAATEQPTKSAAMIFEEEELALEEAVAKEQLGLEDAMASEQPTAEEAAAIEDSLSAAATEIVDTNSQESQLGSILSGEIDHTCYWDSIDRPGQCQREELMNGVCDDPGIMSVGREECRGQDCFDCNYHCMAFDNDCTGCMNAKGCYYCPASGKCQNTWIPTIECPRYKRDLWTGDPSKCQRAESLIQPPPSKDPLAYDITKNAASNLQQVLNKHDLNILSLAKMYRGTLNPQGPRDAGPRLHGPKWGGSWLDHWKSEIVTPLSQGVNGTLVQAVLFSNEYRNPQNPQRILSFATYIGGQDMCLHGLYAFKGTEAEATWREVCNRNGNIEPNMAEWARQAGALVKSTRATFLTGFYVGCDIAKSEALLNPGLPAVCFSATGDLSEAWIEAYPGLSEAVGRGDPSFTSNGERLVSTTQQQGKPASLTSSSYPANDQIYVIQRTTEPNSNCLLPPPKPGTGLAHVCVYPSDGFCEPPWEFSYDPFKECAAFSMITQNFAGLYKSVDYQGFTYAFGADKCISREQVGIDYSLRHCPYHKLEPPPTAAPVVDSTAQVFWNDAATASQYPFPQQQTSAPSSGAFSSLGQASKAWIASLLFYYFIC